MHQIWTWSTAELRRILKKNGSRALSEKTLDNILAVLSTPLQYAAKPDSAGIKFIASVVSRRQLLASS